MNATAHPLTMNQEALWRFQRRQPSSDIYGMLGIACTRDPADPERMSTAYRALLDRHAVLRSGIVVDSMDEASCVVIDHGPDTALLCIDGRAWDAAALATFVEERFARAHETTRTTLFHAAMVTIDASVAASLAGNGVDASGPVTGAPVGLLVFTAHHLVIDFLSFPVLLHDLEALYRNGPDDSHATAYARLKDWDNESAATSGAFDAYARQFAPLPVRLDFGGADAPPAAPPRRELRFTFPDDVRAALVRFASSAGMTPFAAMLTVFAIMLHRQTDVDDLCIAVPTHGRPRRAFARSVGYFANIVPLRQRIDPAMGFREHALRTRSGLRSALRLASVPFGRLAEQADAYDVAPGRSVLAQVGMVWDVMPSAAPATWIDLLQVEQRGTPFALCLTGYISDTQWDFGIKHDPATVPWPVVAGWAEAMARVTATLCSHPDVPLRSLDLVPAPAWHATSDAPPAYLSIDAALRARARHEPMRVVLSQADRRITADELEHLTRSMAHALRERLPVGSRLAILAERGYEGVLAMVAALRAGVAYVPLHPGQTHAWLAQACQRSAVRLIACSTALSARASALDLPVWTIDAWLAAQPASATSEPFVVLPEQEAYVIHTSGSTGAPKAVAVSRHNLECMLRATRFIYADTDQYWTLLHHAAFDFAVWEMWGPLVHGHALRVIDDATVIDPSRLHAEVSGEGITHMGMTPGACRLLLPYLRKHGPGALRTLCVGGAAVDRALAQALAQHGIDAWSFYGPTEATVWATCGPLDAAAPDGWIGTPFPGMRAYVLDNALRWVPAHRTGDLYLAGGQLAQYPGLPALSAERFVPDPWHPGERMYRTGDRATYDRVAGLRFLGRDDRQVKIHGYRVELDGLAALLRACEGFIDVACAQLPAQGLVAFYATASGHPLPADWLHAAAAEVLPAYVLPVQFVHRDAIPLNRNGKHDTDALLASLRVEQANPVAAGAGEVPWLDTIVGFLRHELGVPTVSPDTPFHELGAQSIALARLHGMLVASFPGLKLEDLYAYPTPGALALRLSRPARGPVADERTALRGPRRALRRGGR